MSAGEFGLTLLCPFYETKEANSCTERKVVGAKRSDEDTSSTFSFLLHEHKNGNLQGSSLFKPSGRFRSPFVAFGEFNLEPPRKTRTARKVNKARLKPGNASKLDSISHTNILPDPPSFFAD
ncbi:hypothetical protein CIRG_07142 [Coccidioides immitis RMSCC 2394]|uniref:Uncharacterized protein n=1 Tax=Coccidioides immitis RMSCC 2394 TaxID=404692 RepID=A0A0J6YIL3_COCIT|nr:hypothetical protein CIRG_07142 [Coccidioides immitis RMSCC 2394]